MSLVNAEIHIILTSQTIDSTVFFISHTIDYNQAQSCAKLHIQHPTLLTVEKKSLNYTMYMFEALKNTMHDLSI